MPVLTSSASQPTPSLNLSLSPAHPSLRHHKQLLREASLLTQFRVGSLFPTLVAIISACLFPPDRFPCLPFLIVLFTVLQVCFCVGSEL